MSLSHYFPGEPHHPLVDQAVEALLGSTPPAWASLKPDVQAALLLLRRVDNLEERRLLAIVEDLKGTIDHLRDRSFMKDGQPS